MGYEFELPQRKMERYICVICDKPVEVSAELKPDAPHHWECWKNAPQEQIDAIYNRVKTIRNAWEGLR